MAEIQAKKRILKSQRRWIQQMMVMVLQISHKRKMTVDRINNAAFSLTLVRIERKNDRPQLVIHLSPQI